jgi:hypothetical protein
VVGGGRSDGQWARWVSSGERWVQWWAVCAVLGGGRGE